MNQEDIVITSARHKKALENAAGSVNRGRKSLGENAPDEIVAIDIVEAISSLNEISGIKMGGDVLDIIFSRFCVGK